MGNLIDSSRLRPCIPKKIAQISKMLERRQHSEPARSWVREFVYLLFGISGLQPVPCTRPKVFPSSRDHTYVYGVRCMVSPGINTPFPDPSSQRVCVACQASAHSHIALTALAHNSLTAGLDFYKNNFVCMACLGLWLCLAFGVSLGVRYEIRRIKHTSLHMYL